MSYIKVLFFVLLISLAQSISIEVSSQDKLKPTTQDQSWEEKQYYLPEHMKSTGSASSNLVAEQTLSDSAGVSLIENSQQVFNAVKEMKNIGIKEEELSTQNLRIFRSYKQDYDEQTKKSKQTFEGYKVQNVLRLKSNRMDLAGKVIDITVKNGITEIESVSFVPTSTKVKQLKDSLLSKAVLDSVNKATLLLEPLDYEIKSIISVNLLDNESYNNIPLRRNLPLAGEFLSLDESTNTQLYQSNQQINVIVDVTFLIGKKENTTQKF